MLLLFGNGKRVIAYGNGYCGLVVRRVCNPQEGMAQQWNGPEHGNASCGNGRNGETETGAEGPERHENGNENGNGNGTGCREGNGRERERAPGTDNGTDFRNENGNGLHGAGVIMGGWSGGVPGLTGTERNGPEWIDGGSDGPGVKLFVKLLFCE